MKNLEILSPAGNFESFKAAIFNGADAVYLGLENFNARIKAGNFTLENLKSTVDFAHLYGVKVYLTANTLIKDEEMSQALEMIKHANKAGIDAIIIQDLGLVSEIMSTMPHITLHASTQLGIHNLKGAKFIEKLGIKRVVLSRETLLADIKKIKENTNLELEFFVQGALCVSFSGNCYFSSLVSGFSGNRGKCLQLCRKKYCLTNKEKSDDGYWLSAKDISMAKRLEELIEAGITSFKIEGRIRRPEYVAESTRIYKELLSRKYCDKDIDDLKTVYNRGDYCSSHLDGTENIIYKDLQGHKGLKIGTVSRIIDKYAFINSKIKLNIGDGIKFINNGKESGTALVSHDGKTTYLGEVKVGEEVYLTTAKLENEKILKREKKLALDIEANFRVGEKPRITFKSENVSIDVVGEDVLSPSINAPIKEQSIIKNLSKLGDSEFNLQEINIVLQGDLFIAISQLNELRRKGIQELKIKIIDKMRKVQQSDSIMSDIILSNDYNYMKYPTNSVFLQIEKINQINEKILTISDFIVFNPEVYDIEVIKEFKNFAKNKAILNLPILMRGKDSEILNQIVNESGIENFIINNCYGFELCKGKNIILGTGMNQLNNCFSASKISSIETDKIQKDSKNIIYCFGFFPFMTFTHCVKKNSGGNCLGCKGYEISLTDEYRNSYLVKRTKLHYCYGNLVNNLPINILDKVYNTQSSFLIDVGNLSKESIEKILKCIKNKEYYECEKTKGNFIRGLK